MLKRPGAVLRCGTGRPQRIVIELDRLRHRTAKYHRAERAVSNGKRLVPVRRGLAIPELSPRRSRTSCIQPPQSGYDRQERGQGETAGTKAAAGAHIHCPIPCPLRAPHNPKHQTRHFVYAPRITLSHRNHAGLPPTLERDAFARTPAKHGTPQRRLRCDHHDFLTVALHRDAAIARPHEIEIAKISLL